MSPNETNNTQQQGQNVALLETRNGVTVLNLSNEKNGNISNGNDGNNKTNDVQIRQAGKGNDEDDSFEYATDRESSVYNPTTMPLRDAMAAAGGRNSQKPNTSSGQAELLSKGNQLGIPESRFSRWIPKDQREILEKQAKLLAQRIKPKTPEPESELGVTASPYLASSSHALSTPHNTEPTETEIYSDTESADVRATTSTTTTTTAAVSEESPPSSTNTSGGGDNNGQSNKKKVLAKAADVAAAATKRLPSFTALFKRINDRDPRSSYRRKDASELDGNLGATATTTSAATIGGGDADSASSTTNNHQQQTTGEVGGTRAMAIDGNDNQAKEDKQLVYAELILKPSENNEPLPPKSSTEYAEIVYVKKTKPNELPKK